MCDIYSGVPGIVSGRSCVWGAALRVCVGRAGGGQVYGLSWARLEGRTAPPSAPPPGTTRSRGAVPAHTSAKPTRGPAPWL